ncbi:hypothetical protein B0H63DRAFT_464259 [Podospora didyma]|uniref:Uncharacterized protein n=1 Tax=Podospora didyma TaxID=330526 RepID=A0AAE0NY08_9PEZI|nr:hypothetical protein B0H63DRAFT_464259 [Podospora didyma]
MTPHHELLSRKLARASDVVDKKEMAKALPILQGLLDHLAKSPSVQLGRDIHELYARALLGSDTPSEEMVETFIKYPEISTKAIYLSTITAHRLLLEERCTVAYYHLIIAKESMRRANGCPAEAMEKVRTAVSDLDGVSNLHMYIDIKLARCYLERLKMAKSGTGLQ